MNRKAIVTGASGTLGRHLVTYLKQRGWTVVPWQRQQVSISDYAKMEAFLARHRPEALFHLAIATQPSGQPDEEWLVNYHWPSELAWICRQHRIHFVFASTAKVFSDDALGPFTLGSMPDARDDYGQIKREAEARVLYQNPQAWVVRLGWQIDYTFQGNQMLNFLYRQYHREGRIEANRGWLPACSFIEDSVAAMVRALKMPPGIYMVDSNRYWHFDDIVGALLAKLGLDWPLHTTHEQLFDQRMIDTRLGVPPLHERLPELL